MTDSALAEENARLKARLAETEAALADTVDAQKRLESIVSELRREKFGRKSEKLDPEQFNLPLEDIEVAQGVLETAQEKARDALKGKEAGKGGKADRNRGHLPKHLPRIERIIEPETTLCPCGCGEMTRVDRSEGPWTLVHCWTHARRRFVKRLEKDGSPIAEEALRQIAELYAIEKTVRGSAPEARLAARRELSAPIIEAFRPWLAAQLARIPKSSKLAEDIRYTLAHWAGLTRFLAENWALLASLIANCKMADVNPVSYLANTLQALLDGHPKSRIDELMPCNFAVTSTRAA